MANVLIRVGNLSDHVDTEKKVVEIYKGEVYKDIELHTFKKVDASGNPDQTVRNAVSADNAEHTDGSVSSRSVEFRDAQLRTKLRFAIAEEDRDYADDDIDQADHMYRYCFNVPVDFNDSTLRSVAEYIHRFLVWGTLYDWYMMMGDMGQAQAYGSQLDDLVDKISSLLRGRSIQKRPMQPFGPRKPF